MRSPINYRGVSRDSRRRRYVLSHLCLGSGVWIGLIQVSQPLYISLMGVAVDVVIHQDRDRNRAKDHDNRNEDHAEVMQDRRVNLARCRMLRKANPSEDQCGKE